MLSVILLFILGLALVIKGGDWFVDSSVFMARVSGLPELFIGATIVSIATTLPEVLVSTTAATKGLTTMSVGNAVGSMICNIGLILGVVIFFSPSEIKGKMFRKKSLFLIAFTSILFLFSINQIISRVEAIILLTLLILYMFYNTRLLKKNLKAKKSTIKIDRNEVWKVGFNFVFGIGAIILGSNLLINNGVVLAEVIGVPEVVISLSLIALGTSLPEFVTALTALKKGNTAISIGNIIGANIFNVTMVIGISGFIEPLQIIKQNLLLDLPTVGILTLALLLPALYTKKVFKMQGVILFVIYLIYLYSLWVKYI